MSGNLSKLSTAVVYDDAGTPGLVRLRLDVADFHAFVRTGR